MFGLTKLPREGSGVMGMPMDMLKQQMANFISGLKTPMECSVDQMVSAAIEVWKQRGQIITCDVRGHEYVWQTTPETKAHNRQSNALVKKSAGAGVVDLILSDIDQPKGYPTHLGHAIH